MAKLELFIPLTKVDAVQRLVYGVATAEKLDRSGEICDYATTKPLYEKWSAAISLTSGGKSLGNLRAMHGKVAAGKLVSINFNDADKQIEICAKVVDDAEWLKVQEGVYTGFSQGGAYVKRWLDSEMGKTRYTADPNEISLVDLPCLDMATFDMVKADGAVEQVLFKSVGEGPTMQEGSDDPAPVYRATDGSEHQTKESAKAHNKKLKDGLDAAKVAGAAAGAEIAAQISGKIDQLTAALGGGTPAAPAAKAADTGATEDDNKPYGDVKYADPGLLDDKKHRYPIDTVAHIWAAWSYINKKKNADQYSAADLGKVKDAIIAAWKDKIDEDGPPSAADKAFLAVELRKGLYNVARLAGLIEELVWLQDSVAGEAMWEMDGSTLPADLKESIAGLVINLRAMVVEETNELFTPLDIDALSPETVLVLELAYPGLPNLPRLALARELNFAAKAEGARTELVKLADVFEKVGARHNAADMQRVQKIHDHAVDMGANCGEAAATPDPGASDAGSSTGDAAKGVKVADLRKAWVDNGTKIATLEKAVADKDAEIATSNAALAELLVKVDALGKMPLPPKGVVMAVNKEDDTGNPGGARPLGKVGSFSEQLAEITDPKQRAAFILKAAHSAPGGTGRF